MMEWLTNLSGTDAYVVLFLGLWASGAGSPIPEDLFLAAGGFLAAIGVITLPGIALCAFLGLLLGDVTAYWLGRRFGRRLTTIAPFRWFITPERLDVVQERFHRHQGKAIFFGRHLVGVRFVTMVFAGMSRVNLLKFAALDMGAACISAPIPVLVAYFVGNPKRAERIATDVDVALAVAIILGLAITWYVVRLRRRVPRQRDDSKHNHPQ